MRETDLKKRKRSSGKNGLLSVFLITAAAAVLFWILTFLNNGNGTAGMAALTETGRFVLFGLLGLLFTAVSALTAVIGLVRQVHRRRK